VVRLERSKANANLGRLHRGLSYANAQSVTILCPTHHRLRLLARAIARSRADREPNGLE
jgi:hypothetical protein